MPPPHPIPSICPHPPYPGAYYPLLVLAPMHGSACASRQDARPICHAARHPGALPLTFPRYIGGISLSSLHMERKIISPPVLSLGIWIDNPLGLPRRDAPRQTSLAQNNLHRNLSAPRCHIAPLCHNACIGTASIAPSLTRPNRPAPCIVMPLAMASVPPCIVPCAVLLCTLVSIR